MRISGTINKSKEMCNNCMEIVCQRKIQVWSCQEITDIEDVLQFEAIL
jgi:hypothetical protein